MAADFEEFCGSEFWNDTLTWESSWPHFTDCFQKTALVWGPCAWLWLTLPVYLVYLMSPRHEPSIPINWLNVSKTFLSLMLGLLCLVDLINVISRDGNVVTPQAHYLAPSLKAASLILTAILIQFERIKGLITSGILFIFFTLLVLVDIVPFYTKIELQTYEDELFDFAVFYFYYALLLIQFFLHCFAEKVSRHGYYSMGEKPSPETKASFLSRITFNWLNTLVLTGYKKALEASDLWDLHPRDKSERVVPQFQEKWENEVRMSKTKVLLNSITYDSSDGPPKYSASETTPLVNGKAKSDKVKVTGKEKTVNNASLFKVMVKVYLPDILRSWACKFIYDLLQFVSPLLLNLMIAFVQTQSTENWLGYVYAAGFFVVAIVQSLFFHAQFHIGLTLGMRIRSALISAVYRKALTMNSEAKKTSTVGEIVNLMSVDCQRVQDMTGYLWMLWSSPLQIALAIYMLWQQLGVSVLAGLAVLVLLIPVNGFLAFKSRKYQVQQMKFKDERLKLMNEVLNGMKVLKLYAWELSFQEKILAIRQKELDVLKKNAYLNAFSSFAWTTAPYLVTLATFATYVQISESHFLDAQKAFVALSLFNILRFPINLLPMMVSYVVMANVSIVRIGKFLRCNDLDEHNVQRDGFAENAITVDNGTFTWDRETEPVLHNINFKAPVGQLVAVVGTVGAGKSSLISAILGEMEKISGRVNLKGSVAYVPQQAWVQNATLKDNILFEVELDPARYDRVVEACALGPDLDILPGGDQTEIGEKGINLSGGQKQRVSLARAVYNDADVYLLDDPLSAVDSHVGKHIFEKVVGEKGMLREKTRVLVTHGVHWLPMVDNIIVIVDGRISEFGSYDELLSHDGPFAQFLKTYLTKEEDSDDEEDDEVQQIRSKMLERLDSVISEPATTSGDDEKGTPKRRKRTSVSEKSEKKSEKSDKKSLTKSLERELSKDQTVGKKLDKDEDKLIQEEKSETGKVKWKVFGTYARYIGVTASIIIVVMYALYQVASVYSNVWLSQWTEDPYLNNRSLVNTSKYQEQNNLYLGVYGGLGVAQAVIVLTYSVICAIRMVAAAGTLHKAMLQNILRSPMEFFDTTPIGRIVNRFSRDIETIDNNLPQIWRMWVNTAFSVVSTLVVISYSTPIFLSVILPIGFLYFLIQRFYVPTSRQLKRLESTTRSPIYSHFSETITGASTIRAYDVAARFKNHSQDQVDKNLVFYFGGIASNRWLGFRLEFCGSCIVLAAAIFAVISRDTIEGGVVGLSISYALQVTGGLNWMVRMTSDLETNIVSVERVQEYSETPTEADWYLPFKRPPRDWPDHGTVEFLDYTTRYRAGLDLVLRGITCEITGCQKVGIVGRTGAGKSSLTVALFRLIESAGGSIVIDGYRIQDMGLHDLRSKLTILPQDPVLFSGTLRMNLDPFDQYNDVQIWQALEHAHLQKFVQESPDKLEHECGEGGQNLSVGQRQLVCLARTLLRKTKILILDEATAAVDMETDDLIQQTIRTEFKDCTVITIAHRLNTIMDYDRVIVMDQGLIKEYDSPDNLLKDQKTIFYGMAKDAGIIVKSGNGK